MIQEQTFGILQEKEHGRIIANLNRIAAQAGIPRDMICTSATEHCEQREIEWFRRMRGNTRAGLAYLGYWQGGVEMRMMAAAGALIRNYIDARVTTVQRIIARAKGEEQEVSTVLFIPNLFVGPQPAWISQMLLDVLYARHAAGLKTVVYVTDLDKLGDDYGIHFMKHIANYYDKLGA